MKKNQLVLLFACLIVAFSSCKQDRPRSLDGLTILNDCNPCELNLYTDYLIQELKIKSKHFTIYKNGNFAYWWDSRYDIQAELPPFMALMESIQDDLVTFPYGILAPGKRWLEA